MKKEVMFYVPVVLMMFFSATCLYAFWIIFSEIYRLDMAIENEVLGTKRHELLMQWRESKVTFQAIWLAMASFFGMFALVRTIAFPRFAAEEEKVGSSN